MVVNYASSPAKAEEVAAEIAKLGGEAITVGANVAKRDELEAMFKAVTDKWGQVDVLVNNAGTEEEACRGGGGGGLLGAQLRALDGVAPFLQQWHGGSSHGGCWPMN